MVEHNGLPEAISRLGLARGGEAAFLEPHQLEAARRLTRTFERARLSQRVTMSYDAARVARSSKGASARSDISASAADARAQLAGLGRQVPRECWDILFDICGLDLGLQELEAARGWPRRSGKLVLRIALSHLAALYGITAIAEGRERAEQRSWLEQRAPMFGPAPRS